MTKVYISEEEMREFKIEAEEFLDSAEVALLAMDKGADLELNSEKVSRAFSVVKGAAGMLNRETLLLHMQTLEDYLQKSNARKGLSEAQVSCFLEGVDAARKMLHQAESQFDFEAFENAFTTRDSHREGGRPASGSGKAADPSISSEPKQPVIIVLDDEYENVEILVDNLKMSNYDVYGFTNPKEAIKAVALKKPQAFFSDMNMPTMNGVEVLHELQKIDIDLPVIFVSAFLSKEILIDAIGLGVFAAIEKPFKTEQIIAVARNATSRYQLWQLLNRSINLVMYQFAALDQTFKDQGLSEARDLMLKEMQSLIDVRRHLREEKLRTLSAP